MLGSEDLSELEYVLFLNFTPDKVTSFFKLGVLKGDTSLTSIIKLPYSFPQPYTPVARFLISAFGIVITSSKL